MWSNRFLSVLFGASWLSVGALQAQTPPEVTNVRFSTKTSLTWNAASGSADYNVYRGLASQLRRGIPPRCHGDEITSLSFQTPEAPAPGEGFVFLVTGEAANGSEGTPGSPSAGGTRTLRGRCDPTMRTNILNRLAFGRDDYTFGRLQALGIDGFINEQLNPAAISEATNAPLNSQLAFWGVPDTYSEHTYIQIIRALYARRQLEEVLALFWDNHFSTDWRQVYEGLFEVGLIDDQDFRSPTELQEREFLKFRTTAFSGTFRDILDDSAFSPAMILYLDGNRNVVGVPQENYGRELMELHTLGVDGGYTQEDVRQMALIWTGWTVCRKTNATKDDPLAPCNLLGNGPWSAHFDVTKHDCRAKTLFAGTPQQLNVPSTCGAGGVPTASGINDATMALDAVAQHPSTRRFVSKKLLQKFVTETPTPAMIDAVVATWQSSGGDLVQLYRTVFGYLKNPDFAGIKVKSGFEQMLSAMRAVRADSNNLNLPFLEFYLFKLNNMPHLFPAPTGYPELGKAWINTNDLLERQNTSYIMATNPLFQEDIIPLLAANGLSAASPPGSVADFLLDVAVGGRAVPADRDDVIKVLTTDDNGNPAAQNDAQIRQAFAFVMGLAPFVEE